MTFCKPYGELAEWFMAAVLKTAGLARDPWVRIPYSPPRDYLYCLKIVKIHKSNWKSWEGRKHSPDTIEKMRTHKGKQTGEKIHNLEQFGYRKMEKIVKLKKILNNF